MYKVDEGGGVVVAANAPSPVRVLCRGIQSG